MASVYLCPITSILQYFTDAGIPLNGGKINTYLAGTSTPTNTWTDATGTVLNSNPIILNSAGRLNNVNIWQAQGTPIKVIIQDSSGNQIGPVFDNLSGINDFVQSQFTAYRSGNQTLTNNATTTAIFNNKITDVNTEYDITTGLFTAKNAGLYVFTAGIQVQSNASNPGQLYGPYYISRNGSGVAANAWGLNGLFQGEGAGTSGPAANGLGAFSGSVAVKLAINDTISVRCQQQSNTGGAFTLWGDTRNTYFSGVRIG